MSHLIKLATSSALVVLGTFWIGTTPAAAEKTAEQIKCEEEGGSWVDKGNGNTFCFKKLPPMHKAGGPSVAGSSGPAKAIINTSRSNIKNVAAPAHAINSKGTGATGRIGQAAAAGEGSEQCPSSSTERGVVSPAGTMTGTANVSAPAAASLATASGTGLVTGVAAGGPVTITPGARVGSDAALPEPAAKTAHDCAKNAIANVR